MSVISVTRIWSGLTSDYGKATIRWDVQTDSGLDSVSTIIWDGRLPRYGDSHPDSPWLYCDTCGVKEVKGPRSYIVEASFSASSLVRFNKDKSPLEEPWDVDTDFVVSVEPYDTDVNGAPLLNAAGEPFDPPQTRENCDPCVVLSGNQANMPDWNANNSLNANKFMGAGPGELRMKLKGKKIIVQQNGFIYWHNTYTIIRRFATSLMPEPWQRRVLNQGFRAKLADSSETPDAGAGGSSGIVVKTSTIRGADGLPIAKPALLDKDGSLLAKDAKATWLLFDDYKTMDWSGLGLPQVAAPAKTAGPLTWVSSGQGVVISQ
jgi:hypothetical protein